MRFHLQHHSKSGQVQDVEERLIGLGMPLGLKRLIVTLTPLGFFLAAPEVMQDNPDFQWSEPLLSSKWQLSCAAAAVVPKVLSDFGLAVLPPSVNALLHTLFVGVFIPSHLRHIAITVVTTYSHYYGDVEPGAVHEQEGATRPTNWPTRALVESAPLRPRGGHAPTRCHLHSLPVQRLHCRRSSCSTRSSCFPSSSSVGVSGRRTGCTSDARAALEPGQRSSEPARGPRQTRASRIASDARVRPDAHGARSFYVNQPFWVRTLSAWNLNSKLKNEWSKESPGALRVNDMSVFKSDNRRGKATAFLADGKATAIAG